MSDDEVISVHLNLVEAARLYFGDGESTASFLRKVAPAIRRQVPYGSLFFFSLDTQKRDYFFDKDDKGEYISETPNGTNRIYIDTVQQNEGGMNSLRRSPFGEAYSTIKGFMNGKLLDPDSSE
jgi:hypothetical protein